jgi:hypothetical protein
MIASENLFLSPCGIKKPLYPLVIISFAPYLKSNATVGIPQACPSIRVMG